MVDTETAKSISNTIETAIRKQNASRVEHVEFRRCCSDKYDGVEVNIYGNYIPAVAAIEAVAEIDGFGIEEIAAVDENDTHLGIFVAEIPTQTHPAFAP